MESDDGMAGRVSMCNGIYIVSPSGLIGLGLRGLSGTGRRIGGLCVRSGLMLPGDPPTYIEGIIISLSLISSTGGLQLLDLRDSVSAADWS